MINIKGLRARIRYRNAMLRRMIVLEARAARMIRPAISAGARAAAKLIEQGMLGVDGLLQEVDATKDRVKNALMKTYQNADSVFVPSMASAVSGEFGRQEAISDVVSSIFLTKRSLFLQSMAAEKVVGVTEFSKNLIRGVLAKGLADNLAPTEIASTLLAKNRALSAVRSLRIARTETHTASVSAQQQVIQYSGIQSEKEWMSSGDDYVRAVKRGDKFDHAAADGERVALNSQYQKTGELLMHPGDPSGSAGNVINCRCVELFHTV